MTAQKRTILITGCSDDSLGAALALAFQKADWRVFATGRNPSRLTQVQAAGIETLPLDVTSEESITACAKRVEELTADDGGSLDALLNNAGHGYFMPVADIEVEKAREMFDLNVFSVISVTQAFLPLLLKAVTQQEEENRKSPMIINHTSAAGITPIGCTPFQGAYNASKAAAASITESLRLEMAPFGIKTINLVSGVVRSKFFDNTNQPRLPEGSIYNVARDGVERIMSAEHVKAVATDADTWAGQVVGDVDRVKPPHWVWRGAFAGQVRMMSVLPVGTTDSLMKAHVGLDVLEKKIREQKATAGGSI